MTEEDDLVRRARARVGTLVKGKWTLDALLGVGGMAAVYSATHRNGTSVAVKWLHPELALDKKMRDRFVREGYIANRVNHPGVVRIIDDDVAEDGSLILLMELLDGETVDARCKRTGNRLETAETLKIGHALLDVVAAAHDAGIVHRDLKPENLFLTRGGELKVLDFGIARLRELSTRSGATGSQSSLGTPAFMPPEQARGLWEEVDGRSDIWAIGATMFALLAGRQVHEARTVNEQLLAAMTQPAPTLASVVPSIPMEVALVIDKALAFKADARWQDARSMGAACADAFAKVTGRAIADGDLSGRLSIDDATLPLQDRPPVESAVRVSPPTLTTGRPVASVLPEVPPPSKPRRRVALLAASALIAALAVSVAAVRLPPRITPAAEREVHTDDQPAAMPSTSATALPAPTTALAESATPPSATTVAPVEPAPTTPTRRVVPAAPRPGPPKAPQRPMPPRVPAPAPAPDWRDQRH